MAKYCHFWTFCKGYSKAKWLQNGRFWERSSDQPTRWLIRPHVKETGASKWRDTVFTWPYSIHFIPTNMVRTRVREICACANKTPTQQHLWTWCQSVVANDFPREREISRPLVHMRQTPFIHSARHIKKVPISIYIEQSSRYFLHVIRPGVY